MFQEPGTIVPSAFVVVGAAHAAALRKRLRGDPTVVVYSEYESLHALREILARPPKVLALDSTVVRTSRGALLVSRMKDTSSVEVRVLTDDARNLPLLLTQPNAAIHAVSQPIEGCGTRAARRFAMTDIHVVIEGARSELINLSVTGAQALLSGRVQPGQSVLFTLVDEAVEKRFRARVAWSTVELTQSAVRYRAGLAFMNPDSQTLETFCHRHGGRG